MNLGTFFVALLLAGIVISIIVRMIRSAKSGRPGSCDEGCPGCTGSCRNCGGSCSAVDMTSRIEHPDTHSTGSRGAA